MTRYTYGDTSHAAERLGVLAEAFEAASRGFLQRAAPASPSLALDLGCGPGHTTVLVHDATGAARTIGLDRSSPFLEAAAARASDAVTFLAHDVLQTPLPVGPAGLIYARLLTAHLADPAAVIAGWIGALTVGGRLLLDEPEEVLTEEPVIRTYLDEVAIPLVRSQGGHLLVGPILHAMADPPGTVRTHDEVATFTPPVAVTARIFAMNLDVVTTAGEIDPRRDLAEGLAAIVEGRTDAEPVTWRMRQIALERRD